MAADAGRALPTAVAHFQRVDGHRSRRHGSMSWTSTDRCTAARKWASRTCLSPVLTSCRGSFACSGQGRKAQTLEAAGAKRWRRRGRGRGRCWGPRILSTFGRWISGLFSQKKIYNFRSEIRTRVNNKQTAERARQPSIEGLHGPKAAAEGRITRGCTRLVGG